MIDGDGRALRGRAYEIARCSCVSMESSDPRVSPRCNILALVVPSLVTSRTGFSSAASTTWEIAKSTKKEKEPETDGYNFELTCTPSINLFPSSK